MFKVGAVLMRCWRESVPLALRRRDWLDQIALDVGELIVTWKAGM